MEIEQLTKIVVAFSSMFGGLIALVIWLVKKMVATINEHNESLLRALTENHDAVVEMRVSMETISRETSALIKEVERLIVHSQTKKY